MPKIGIFGCFPVLDGLKGARWGFDRWVAKDTHDADHVYEATAICLANHLKTPKMALFLTLFGPLFGPLFVRFWPVLGRNRVLGPLKSVIFRPLFEVPKTMSRQNLHVLRTESEEGLKKGPRKVSLF